MSRADTQYLGIIKNILDAGSLGDNRTGMPAYKLPHQIMQFDLEKEFPILTTKFVAFKTSVKEILGYGRNSPMMCVFSSSGTAMCGMNGCGKTAPSERLTATSLASIIRWIRFWKR